MKKFELGTLEEVVIEGASADFVVFIKSLGDKAELVVYGPHYQWLVTREGGTQYIAIPNETCN